MINPYQSPRLETDSHVENRFVRALRQILIIVFSSFLGLIIGYVCFWIAANVEDWSFYTIRRLVTGETAMSKITQHPADKWIMPALLFLFCVVGTTVGFFISLGFVRTWPQRED